MNSLKPIVLLKLISCIVFPLLSSCVYVHTNVSDQYALWDKVVLDFSGPQTSEAAANNPFTDYRMDVLFTSPSGKQYTVPGFYAADGNSAQTSSSAGNIWRVIFSPGEKGIWKYFVSFQKGKYVAINHSKSKAAGFFDGNSGYFSVSERKNNINATYFQSNGKLEYVGDHFLQFSGSKKYFLKGGANSPEVLLGYKEFDQTPSSRTYSAHVKDWRIGDPVWQGNKGKGIIGALNYLASHHNNSFYFLTMNVEGDGKQVWPWISDRDITRFDVSKLDQWGILFEHMNNIGIMAHLVLTETENESFFEWEEAGTTGGFANSRKLYYREMIARFGHLLGVTWNIGEENGWVDYSGDEKHKKANTTAQRKQAAQYIRSLLHYTDPIVIHNGPDEDYRIFIKPHDNILGDKNFSGPSLQGNFKNGNIYSDVQNFVKLSSKAGHKWVVSMDEPYVKSRKMNVDIWRKENVWATFMAGGAGIELYLGGGGDLKQQDLRLFDEFYSTTGVALNYFNNNVPFWDLSSKDTQNTQVWRLANETFNLVYFKEASKVTLALDVGEYTIEWFNPKTNVVELQEVLSVDAGAQPLVFETPEGERLQDWVLAVKKN